MRKLAVLGSLLAVAAAVFVAARVANPVASRAIALSGEPVEAPGAARETGVESPAPPSDALAPVEVADARQPVENGPIRSSRKSSSRIREPRAKRPTTKETIAVVDASTNVPIERFGLRAVAARVTGERVEGLAIATPNLDEHPAGRCELMRTDDEDAFQVVAPGYSPREGSLSALSESGGARVIALSRGASIVGRAASSLGKVPSGHVRVRRAALGAGTGTGTGDLAIAGEFDLSAFLGREQLATLGRQAEFELPDLAPGTYELEVRGTRGERGYVKPIRVRVGERVELAPIQLIPSATLRGQVLVPLGVDPADIRVVAQCDRRTRATRLDAHARFEFEGLVAGPCVLSASLDTKALADDSKLELDLAPGEQRELSFDLRGARFVYPFANAVR